MEKKKMEIASELEPETKPETENSIIFPDGIGPEHWLFIKDPGFPGFEMCRATLGSDSYTCNLQKGHNGDHAAHGTHNVMFARWRNIITPCDNAEKDTP